ncbi:MAG: hypothetical protein JWM33_3293, partial [Caulobacteraceae bacterium]|nr:hypothetical protein [Caulobacteraceae bacterium]
PMASGVDQRAINALRQTFGCSSGQRPNLSQAERSECDRRGAATAATLPDRPAVAPNKEAYFDQVVAMWADPGHIPGTDCKTTVQVVTPKAPRSNLPDGKTSIAVPYVPFTCLGQMASTPKPPDHPSLKALGLGR